MTFDDFLRQACPPLDLEWRKYRRRAARHRVQQRLRELEIPDYAAYLQRLRADPTEAAGLADRMRVTVTRFFREQERWQLLAEQVLPTLLAARPPGAPLRAWSAGCAGGEEPYTLAVLWLAQVQPRHPGAALRILATDIDPPSLDRARTARYQDPELREVPEAIRRRFFHRDGLWSPIPEVKAMVTFASHNLLADPPPGIFDLVCCRYLPFTYFRRERLLAATRHLRQALAPDGALMIGAKEDPGRTGDRCFAPWPGAPGVFRPRGEESPN